jgi:predicted enzyme related to lactoylglutathione lyase
MTNRPVLERAIPVFEVDDIAAAVNFYRNVLGFAEGWSRGSPPTLVQIARDDIEVHLSRRSGSAVASCSFLVQGVDAYFAEVRARGAKIVESIGDRASEMREFILTDPSGNVLSFAESLKKEQK